MHLTTTYGPAWAEQEAAAALLLCCSHRRIRTARNAALLSWSPAALPGRQHHTVVMQNVHATQRLWAVPTAPAPAYRHTARNARYAASVSFAASTRATSPSDSAISAATYSGLVTAALGRMASAAWSNMRPLRPVSSGATSSSAMRSAYCSGVMLVTPMTHSSARDRSPACKGAGRRGKTPSS